MDSRFIWHELLTTDLEKSASFYREVFGYTFEQEADESLVLCNEDGPQCSVIRIPDKLGIPSTWIGYLSVDDIDRIERKAPVIGGSIIIPATRSEGIPAFLMFRGPEGAALKVVEVDGSNASFSDKQGAIAWNELLCSNPMFSFTFLHVLTDWDREAIKQWPSNVYHLCKSNGEPRAGVQMLNKEILTNAHWLCYFLCDELSTSREAVKANGGSLVTTVMDLPNFGKYCVVMDNNDAVFALLQLESQN
jgi:uncharacterized protein